MFRTLFGYTAEVPHEAIKEQPLKNLPAIASAMPNIVREKLEKGWIRCRIIVQILGAPKEYVTKTLKLYVEKMKKDDDLYVVNADFSKPKKEKELYAVFVE